ncbi:hypothetical protein EVAR_57046_1 [Eumeta japonica]|uniref:Uncharacterized protein n=1 Tax=Eumeta variegata TaxID=151549 RepID=A0A4C1YMK3_EUMVA|nr:hypothetical protein EVAR_57046_1 [Eumeta japonica]
MTGPAGPCSVELAAARLCRIQLYRCEISLFTLEENFPGRKDELFRTRETRNCFSEWSALDHNTPARWSPPPLDTRSRKRRYRHIAAFWEGLGYLMMGEWATGTVAHWTKQTEKAYFTFVFSESVRRSLATPDWHCANMRTFLKPLMLAQCQGQGSIPALRYEVKRLWDRLLQKWGG